MANQMTLADWIAAAESGTCVQISKLDQFKLVRRSILLGWIDSGRLPAISVCRRLWSTVGHLQAFFDKHRADYEEGLVVSKALRAIELRQAEGKPAVVRQPRKRRARPEVAEINS